MTAFAVFYLFGALLGEVALLALWFKGSPANATMGDYWRDKRGDVILSATLGLVTALAWAEGTIAKIVIDHFRFDLPDTLGVSIIAGFIVSVFAHQILRFFGRRTGLDREDGPRGE